MLNNNRPRYKCSKLERKMNMDVLFCVIVLFCMCLVGALGKLNLQFTPSPIPYNHGNTVFEGYTPTYRPDDNIFVNHTKPYRRTS